jgi:hypothetical protein
MTAASTSRKPDPSLPVEILGLQGTPQAGDRFAVVEKRSRAREIAEYRQRLAREKAAARQSGSRGSLEQMMTQLQDTGSQEFPLLVKGDVQGSVEAIAAPSRSSAPTRSRPGSSIRAPAASPSPISASPRHRVLRSSASTCVPTSRRAMRPSATVSRSATTTSSTIWWMT